MAGLVGFWSHALAAVLYGALALWQLRHWNRDPRNRPLAAAFAVTSLWAMFVALLGPYSAAAGIAESGRNFAFLAFMYGIVRGAADDHRQRALQAVYTAVAAVIGLQLTIAGVAPEFAGEPIVYAALTATAQIIGLTIAAGSLVLVHNLYGQAAPDSRWGIRLPMIALAGMWMYDLHVCTVGYLTRAPVQDLVAMRGAILSMLVPLFALASRRNARWGVRLSRAATFQSISVMAIFAYLVMMMSATRAIEIVGGDWVRTGQVALIFGMTLVALVLLPSGRMRAWARVIVAKHFFQHRYDYREEWLRFTRTIGVAGEGEAPLGQRVIKALADIAEAPAGLLLVPDESGGLALAARWNWHGELDDSGAAAGGFVPFLEGTSAILDFGAAPAGIVEIAGRRAEIPAWLCRLEDAWAGIPLLHKDRLVGLVVLTHPLVRRPLDWEDFDLFRTAGIQAASYLAEARSQEALAEVQRFDEFNRRFAFILHDIKNLVSQLSLVARNAERHAHNPEFREDMVATLQASVKKMNDLLARLDRGSANVEAEAAREIAVSDTVAAVAQLKRRVHPIDVDGDGTVLAIADPGRLRQALEHLVQNAIDASPAGEPVGVTISTCGAEAAIEVRDRGSGMSADFVRSRLFQPFASTKDGGFGVGAFEARALIVGMGGRLEVESRPGEGSRFTVFLPLGATRDALLPERMRA
ncbi:MAG TPA: XrtA/PEP-CTERM system histidine kinase PrsK [Allosphingosinicella sp.]|jgi:putative PEP-CTERM system histidine kinase